MGSNTHTHTHTYACTHTHTHTHTQEQIPCLLKVFPSPVVCPTFLGVSWPLSPLPTPQPSTRCLLGRGIPHPHGGQGKFHSLPLQHPVTCHAHRYYIVDPSDTQGSLIQEVSLGVYWAGKKPVSHGNQSTAHSFTLTLGEIKVSVLLACSQWVEGPSSLMLTLHTKIVSFMYIV